MEKIKEISEKLLNDFREKGCYRHLSPTSLKEFKKSPSHFLAYLAKKDDSREISAAKIKGHAFECLFFEPENFEKKFFVFDADLRPKVDADFKNSENRRWKKEITDLAGEKMILEKNVFEIVKKAAEIGRKKPVCEFFLQQKNGYTLDYQKELIGEISGVPFKGFLDAVITSPKSGKIVLDTKSKGDGSGIDDREARYYIQKWGVALQMLIYKQLAKADAAFIILADTNSEFSADVRLFDLSGYFHDTQKGLDFLLKRYKDWYENYDCQPLSSSQFYPSESEMSGNVNFL